MTRASSAPVAQESARERLTRFDWFFLLVGIGLSAAFRLTYYVDHGPGDIQRYVELARSLLEGTFGRGWRPSTGFAPGYPLFIASVLWSTGSLGAVIGVQFALSLLVPILVWAAARPFSQLAARVAFLLLACSPEVAARPGLLMAEGVAMFLSGLVALSISAVIRQGPSLLNGFCLAIVSAGLVMTTPLMVPLIGAIGAWVLVSRDWRFVSRLGFVLGCALWFVPWQAWVYGIKGRPSYTLFDLDAPEYDGPKGYLYWLDQWYETPQDVLDYMFHAPRPDRFPDRGLPRGATRESVLPLTTRTVPTSWFLPQETQEGYRRLGEQLAAEKSTMSRRAMLLKRGVTLWTEYSPAVAWVAVTHNAGGLPRGVQRAIWWWAFGAHWVLLGGLLVGFGLLLLRGPMPLSLVPAVTVVYSAFSCVGFIEARRNLPLVPLLLLGLCWWSSRAPAAPSLRSWRGVRAGPAWLP